MKKLILITSAALIGFISQATAALTVDTPVGSSDLANELRTLSSADWATALTSGTLNTSVGVFGQNDAIDDGGVSLSAGQGILVESIYKKATFVNDFGEASAGQILTNTDLTQSARVTTDVDDTLVFGFDTDTTNLSPGEAAGSVNTGDNAYVWTFVNPENSQNPTYYLWFLEDYDVDAGRRDDDFNDFIVLGSFSAVPEPSTIISLIAVGFLGLVAWRNRRKVRA